MAAAVLSAAQLALTRHWKQGDLDAERRSETRAWALDALKEGLVEHINLSFKIGRACSEALVAREAADLISAEEAYKSSLRLHTDYMDLLINLRVFGTPQLVDAAEQLNCALDILLDITFWDDAQAAGRRPFTRGTTSRPSMSFAEAKAGCMTRREVLINDAREYLRLPRDAKINRAI